jgi:diadenosine tetraphosphate (Ap4A) HIT family hydrolase
MAPIVEQTARCFLCVPNEDWIWARSEHFFAIAALGPVVEGMSIVASKAHVPSMFDLSSELFPELAEFTDLATARLTQTFGRSVHVTEHGRVGLCEVTAGQYDQHCYHAHRLLFPTDDVDFLSALGESVIEPLVSDAFPIARALAEHLTEYLYYAGPDGRILVGTNDESTPRQFFRGVVADGVGEPELRSWRSHPRVEMVDSAAGKLATR